MDKTNLTEYKLFSTPIISKECDIDIDGAIEWVYRVKNAGGGVKISNRLGWQSDNLIAEDGVDILLRPIAQTLGEIFELSLKLQRPAGVTIGNIWANISGRGAFNWSHTHPGCVLSGVLYLKTPPRSGSIVFEAPHDSAYLLSLLSQETREGYGLHADWWPPTYPGQLLLFPAHVKHRVEPNQSDRDRISVAFNININ